MSFPHRRVVALALVVLVVLGVSYVSAQSTIYPRFSPANYVSYPVAAPCFSTHPVTTTSHDNTLWLTWTCADGRAIVVGPPAVIKVQSPAQTPKPTSCDASKMIANTGLNECQWAERYYR